MMGTMTTMAQDAVTTATYGNAKGNTTRTMTIALNRTIDYVAFQAELALPANTTVKEVTAKSPLINNGTVDLSTKGGDAEESTNFKLAFNQSGTTCKLVGYNLGNKKIAGTSGDILLTVTLETTAGIDFDASTVTTKNVAFVKASDLKEQTMPNSETEARLWGDVVKNGVVDVNDFQTVGNIIAGKTVDKSADLFAADVVNNDKLDVNDYQQIANKIAGK